MATKKKKVIVLIAFIVALFAIGGVVVKAWRFSSDTSQGSFWQYLVMFTVRAFTGGTSPYLVNGKLTWNNG